MDLHQLQLEHQTWLKHNFPDQTAYQPLLGVVEEVGELAHAHLKGEQNIRFLGQGTEANVRAKMDAVGDIVIFLAGYCSNNSLDLGHCVQVTWDKVKQRDWIADPEGVNA